MTCYRLDLQGLRFSCIPLAGSYFSCSSILLLIGTWGQGLNSRERNNEPFCSISPRFLFCRLTPRPPQHTPPRIKEGSGRLSVSYHFVLIEMLSPGSVVHCIEYLRWICICILCICVLIEILPPDYGLYNKWRPWSGRGEPRGGPCQYSPLVSHYHTI